MRSVSRKAPPKDPKVPLRPPPERIWVNISKEERDRLEFLAKLWGAQGKTDGTMTAAFRYMLGNFGEASKPPLGVLPENGGALRQKFEIIGKILQGDIRKPALPDQDVVGQMTEILWTSFKNDHTLAQYLRGMEQSGG